MYPVRINSRAPQVYRVCRAAPSPAPRGMSLFPRFVQSELAPVFRLLDEVNSLSVPRASGYRQSFRSFQPRFDVKESKDGYELHGELPGIEGKDISIEFTDANTLSIKGRTEHHHEEGTRPTDEAQAATAEASQSEATQVEAPAEQEKVSESETSSYHKASVEDEFETIEKAEATPADTPAETTTATPADTSAEASATAAASQEVAPASKSESSRYWVSERSVGSFSRTFRFPTRVNQDLVKASLKNGILSLTIPKAAVPESKRINIE